MCPICGRSIAVEPETGNLLTHAPETLTGPYILCSGSGVQVEAPKEEVVVTT